MAEKKKSIIEEALLDVTRIQEALNTNAKEILRSVAKEEIDSVIKESLNEDDYEEEDVEDTDLDLADAGSDDEVDAGAETSGDEFGGDDEESTDTSFGNDEDEAGMDDMEGGEETSYDGGEESDDYELDMTSASDDEVIAVYKKLSGDDEIEVVSDNEVIIKDPVSGSEYQVKLGGSKPAAVADDYTDSDDMDTDLDLGNEYGDEEEVEEEVVFEIALDEDGFENEITEDKVRTASSDIHMGKEKSAPNSGDIEGQTADKDADSGDNLEGGFDDDGQNGSGDGHGDHIMKEEEGEDEEEDMVDENLAATRGQAGRQGAKMSGSAHHPNPKNESVDRKKYNALLAEATELKKQNDEFRSTLKKFRTMLGETVVFNTNLTNVTRLFTEHSTTKEEKESIIKRFDDEVTTIKESKRLYKTIATELASKKPISESIENKISKEVTSGTSKQLTESTVYVDASTQRIMDLIKRVETPRD